MANAPKRFCNVQAGPKGPALLATCDLRLATCDGLLEQNLREEVDRTRVARLPERLHRLPPNLGVPVALREVDQPGHALVARQLAERKDGSLLDLDLRIAIDRVGDGRCRLIAGALGEPHKRLAAHVGRAAVPCEIDEHSNSGWCRV